LHEKKEKQDMNYMNFEPHLIRERNEQVQREVDSLRLEKRLREDRGSSGLHFVALARMVMMPLLRAARLAG
jgi:hypothetical protein